MLTYRPPNAAERNVAGSNNAVDEAQKNEEELQAIKTLRKIVDDSLANENKTGPPLEEITYYEKETIATLFLGPEGDITRCRLIEVM